MGRRYYTSIVWHTGYRTVARVRVLEAVTCRDAAVAALTGMVQDVRRAHRKRTGQRGKALIRQKKAALRIIAADYDAMYDADGPALDQIYAPRRVRWFLFVKRRYDEKGIEL